MQLGGDWPEALWRRHARAAERFTQGVLNQRALGHAALPAGRDPSPAGRVRRSRGRLPRGEPARAGAAAGARPAAAGPGKRGRRGGRDPPGAERGDAAAQARRSAARLRRDHARRRRRRARPAAPAASSRRSPTPSGAKRSTPCRRMPRGAVALAEGDARGCPGRAAQRLAGVAGARGAERGGAGSGADGSGLPRLWGTTTRPTLELEAARDVFAAARGNARRRPRRLAGTGTRSAERYATG